MKKLCLFLLLACSMVQAQNMFVHPSTGSQTSYPVAGIQKLTFDNGNMLVTNNTGSNGSFALSELRYVDFTDVSLGTIKSELATNKFYAYPNPASHVLNISGSSKMQRVSHIEILSLEGRVLLQQKPTSETAQVNISALPQGMYLCKIINQSNKSQTIKFLKQ